MFRNEPEAPRTRSQNVAIGAGVAILFVIAIWALPALMYSKGPQAPTMNASTVLR